MKYYVSFKFNRSCYFVFYVIMEHKIRKISGLSKWKSLKIFLYFKLKVSEIFFFFVYRIFIFRKKVWRLNRRLVGKEGLVERFTILRKTRITEL